MMKEFLYGVPLVWATIAHFVEAKSEHCKCGPENSCWPSQNDWKALNLSVAGQLIKDEQPANVCYPGPQFDSDACTFVDNHWSNSTFQADTTVGLSYPIVASPCPPVNLTAHEEAGMCRLGYAPRYTINATSVEQISEGIRFAKKHNVRLVVRNTGHDILGRSTGYGSLQIWVRYLRYGIQYQKSFKPLNSCNKSAWNGSAFRVGGGYVWSDMYAEADARNLIVVGGGDPSVGVLGGWMQGGGHSPATRNYGLGADQVLEAQIVLANGTIVIANSCENQDLFFAVRGGGPATYGIVTSTIIKAYPSQNITSQSLSFAPINAKDRETFMEALADVYESFPQLSDEGYSGYGSWGIASPTPIFGNFTIGYAHTIAKFGASMMEGREAAKFLTDKLTRYNKTSLFVSISYQHFPNYKSYFWSESGVQQPVGTSSALGSRFLDGPSLNGSRKDLETALDVIAGTPDEFTANDIVFVGGGAVSRPDPESGVNPAWRSMYVHQIVARGWPPNSTDAYINSVFHDVTYKKIGALRKLAPDTGCYMNEADRRDQLYAQDFYGEHLRKLLEVKRMYDPDGVFYCKTCVGSAEWEMQSDRLCRKSAY